MAQHRAKHRAARKRPIRTHGLALVAAPVAATVTLSAIGLGVDAAPSEAGQVVVSESTGLERLSDRAVAPTRSSSRADVQARAREERQEAARAEETAQRRQTERRERREVQETEQAVAGADTRLWTTTELNLWTDSDGQAEQRGILEEEKRVLVTGRSEDGREEIVLDGESRWVTAGYLEDEKPAETGLDVECTNGSSIATPVSQNIVDIHQVVCGNFPDVTSYGTLRSDGEHSQGLAMDIMVSGDRGYEVAEFLKANYAELGINYLIYSQRIWSVDRNGEGWRSMEDRGSTTANHYDHVHVTTY